jgi:hydrogenase nickel incorporation protein HypA/HybF
MHEVSVAQSILDIIIEVAQNHKAKKIRSVSLKIGKLTCINIESLRFAFKCISENTLAEDAELFTNVTDEEDTSLQVESIEVE